MVQPIELVTVNACSFYFTEMRVYWNVLWMECRIHSSVHNFDYMAAFHTQLNYNKIIGVYSSSKQLQCTFLCNLKYAHKVARLFQKRRWFTFFS